MRVTGTVVSNIRDPLPVPLVKLAELGRELAALMRKRIHDQGLAGDGAPWSPYKSKRKPPKRGDRFYWTRVGEPAPEMHRLAMATKGRYAGRSAYPSFAHWREAMGVSGDQKRFKLTGELEESLEPSMPRPAHLTIAYSNRLRRARYGRAKSGKPYTNQKVAQFAFRSERMSPMQPSAAEQAFVQEFVARQIPEQTLKDLRLSSIEDKALKTANRVQRRTNRLLSGAGVRVR